jgi:hypothetical protein
MVLNVRLLCSDCERRPQYKGLFAEKVTKPSQVARVQRTEYKLQSYN